MQPVTVETRLPRAEDCSVVAERLQAFGNDVKENRKALAAQERGERVQLVAWHAGDPVARVAVR